MKLWKKLVLTAVFASFVSLATASTMASAETNLNTADNAYYHCYRYEDYAYEDCDYRDSSYHHNYKHGGHHGCW